MAQQCPLIFRHVDATVIRINTFFAMSAVIGFLFTHSVAILLLLIGDFALRLSGYKSLSPIQNISLLIQRNFSFPSKMEDAGAKRLAAYFGVAFSVALVIFQLIGIKWTVDTIAALYLFCAGLELFFGYCIACKIYTIAKKICPKRFV